MKKIQINIDIGSNLYNICCMIIRNVREDAPDTGFTTYQKQLDTYIEVIRFIHSLLKEARDESAKSTPARNTTKCESEK